MSVNNINPNNPVARVIAKPVMRSVGDAAATKPMRGTDRLELSGMSHLLKSLQANEVRTDKVAEIKSAIEKGTYDADGAKLDGAIDKLLDDLSK